MGRRKKHKGRERGGGASLDGKEGSTAPWNVASAWQELQTADGITYYYNATLDVTQEDRPEALRAYDDDTDGDTWVWVADAEHGFIPGRVTEWNGERASRIETEAGRTVKIKANRNEREQPLYPLDRGSLRGTHDDLVQMGEIDEGIILYNIRERFRKDVIYTNIGTILIVVNPYKWFKIYEEARMDKYHAKGAGASGLDPHIFDVAENAFRQMSDALTNDTPPNQSILISGESGAGKTEATKQCLRYLAHVAGSAVDGVETRLLSANPLLEAFGNAATLRNYNSSRFGKWMEVFFDDQRQIVGANINNYLLEKSRVTQQGAGERNYHIFYEICAAASREQKQRWSLRPASAFRYTRTHTTIADRHWSDTANYAEVMEAFAAMGFDDETVDQVMQLVAALLHVGNIELVPGEAEDSSRVANGDVLATAAGLLGVPPDALATAITQRSLRFAKRETVVVPLDPVKASDNRDALVKSIYSVLFDWLVWRVNASIAPPPEAGPLSLIGILDIFGFEIFEVNSFEQLCINFTNEKLQQHFNQHTFKLEQQLYMEEGIEFTRVTFVDNQPCLDLIEEKPAGILPTLDEELLAPSGSDARFVDKLLTRHEGKSERFGRALRLKLGFRVYHYAGQVDYDATGFLDKNQDRLEQDLLTLAQGSTNVFLRDLFEREEAAASNRTKSIASQFKSQLNELMTELNATDPHYVRCIKPNSVKRPGIWDGFDCLQQLRYAGIFEAVRIRQTGFPWRYHHDEFAGRYGMFNGYAKQRSARATCEAIVDAAGLGDHPDLQIGRSRVLYRAAAHRALEIRRSLALEKASLTIQRVFRGFRARTLFRKMRKVSRMLLDAMLERNLQRLREAVDDARGMWFQLAITDEAEALCVRLEEEAYVRARLESLQGADPEAQYEEIIDCVRRAKALDIASPLLDTLEASVGTIHMRKQAVKDLIEGTSDYDQTRIRAGLEMVTQLGLAMDAEVERAQSVLQRIAAEMAVVEEMRRALASTDVGQIATLEAALARGRKFHLRTPEGRQAERQLETTIDIRRAIVSRDWTLLRRLVSRATDLDLGDTPEVARARHGLDLRDRMERLAARLADAVGAKDAARMRKSLDAAYELGMDVSPWSTWAGDVDAAQAAYDTHMRIVDVVEGALARHATRRVGPLQDALDQADAYGFRAADDLDLVARGEFVLQVRQSIAGQDWEELRDVVDDADSEEITHHELVAAKRGLQLRRLMQAVADFAASAQADRDLAAMQQALDKAIDLDMEDSLWSSWPALVPRLEEAIHTHESITQALESNLGPGTATRSSLPALRDAVARARDFGFSLEKDLELVAEARFTLGVREALVSLDWESMARNVERAFAYDVASDEIVDADGILDLRADMARVAKAMRKAIGMHDGRRLAELTVEAAALEMGTSRFSSWHELVGEASDCLRKCRVLMRMYQEALRWPPPGVAIASGDDDSGDASGDGSDQSGADDDPFADGAAAGEGAGGAAAAKVPSGVVYVLSEEGPETGPEAGPRPASVEDAMRASIDLLSAIVRRGNSWGWHTERDCRIADTAELVLAKRQALLDRDWRMVRRVAKVARELELIPLVRELAETARMVRVRKTMKHLADYLSRGMAAQHVEGVRAGFAKAQAMRMGGSPWSSWHALMQQARAFLHTHDTIVDDLTAALDVACTRETGALMDAVDRALALGWQDPVDLILLDQAELVLALRLAAAEDRFGDVAALLQGAHPDFEGLDAHDAAFALITDEVAVFEEGMAERDVMVPVAMALLGAVEARDVTGIREGLVRARGLQMDRSRWSSWAPLMEEAQRTLQEHKGITATLIQAMQPEAVTLTTLAGLLHTADSFGFTVPSDTQLVENVRVLYDIRTAIRDEAWSALEAHLARARRQGVQTEEVRVARVVFDQCPIALSRTRGNLEEALEEAMADALQDDGTRQQTLRLVLKKAKERIEFAANAESLGLPSAHGGSASTALTLTADEREARQIEDAFFARAVRKAEDTLFQIETIQSLLRVGMRHANADELTDALELADAIGYHSPDVEAARVLHHELAVLAREERAQARAAKRSGLQEGADPTTGNDRKDKKAKKAKKKKKKKGLSKVDQEGMVLVEPWRMAIDAASGDPYYVHGDTGVVQWEHPGVEKDDDDGGDGAAVSEMKPRWGAFLDDDNDGGSPLHGGSE